MRMALLIQYDGSRYHGWQIQKGQITIQECLERGLTELYGKPISVMGSGRTDSGVHALGQVAHFDHDEPSIPAEKVWMALNQKLPRDIRVIDSRQVDDAFHSRFDARERRYRYELSTQLNLLRRNSQWYVRFPMEMQTLGPLAEMILGEHDFSSFCYAGTETENMICNIRVARWTALPDDTWCFEIHGDRFLHHMVRMLVGSMIEVARGKWDRDDFKARLANPDRRAHAVTAPAHGLALMEVRYAPEMQPEWQPSKLNLVSEGPGD